MSSLYDLDRIVNAIKSLEEKMRNVQVSLSKNRDEIAVLELLQRALEENISELKDAPIILAHEFRKATEDASRAHFRLSFMEIERQTLTVALNSQAATLKRLEKQYEDILDKTRNNVIQVSFGRKDDR